MLEAFEAKRPTLKDGGKAGRWLSPIVKHVIPKIGKYEITSLTQRDVANCLQPKPFYLLRVNTPSFHA
jgi:hypothetical protein